MKPKTLRAIYEQLLDEQTFAQTGLPYERGYYDKGAEILAFLAPLVGGMPEEGMWEWTAPVKKFTPGELRAIADRLAEEDNADNK